MRTRVGLLRPISRVAKLAEGVGRARRKRLGDKDLADLEGPSLAAAPLSRPQHGTDRSQT